MLLIILLLSLLLCLFYVVFTVHIYKLRVMKAA
jgi:hypothetical protein